MPKPPSKHGLERKYKPWRRGMSKKGGTTNNKPKSSLKNQLRGKERLLAKLSKDDKDYESRRADLESAIKELREEISKNTEKERHRKNAADSHGTRFLERQRLTRMERTVRKHLESGENEEKFEKELLLVALDQVYVAHYPHDVKYQPLFRKGVRNVDSIKAAHKRAAVRKRILEQLANKQVTTVNWISTDQYKRVPEDWTVDMETSLFGCRANETGPAGDETTTSDDRFALNQQHSALLEAAEKLESKLDKEEQEVECEDEEKEESGDGTDDEESRVHFRNESESDDKESSSSSSDSDEDVADPLQRQPSQKPAITPPQDDSSSSDSDDSSSTSSTSSDESSDDDTETKSSLKRSMPTESQEAEEEEEEEEEDDFLVPVDDEEEANAFETTKNQLPAWDKQRGDKSQGWATQRQTPGQWKKKRQRR